MKILNGPTKKYVCERCGAEFFPDNEKEYKKNFVGKPKYYNGEYLVYGSFTEIYIECPFCKERIIIDEILND